MRMWRRFFCLIMQRKEEEEKDEQKVVCTVSPACLPNHMRTVFLASERRALVYPLLRRNRNERPRLSVALIAIALSLLVVGLLYFVLRAGARIKTFHDEDEKHQDKNGSKLEQAKLVNKLWKNYRTDALLRSDRAPCVTECWTYAAFHFKSTCEDGFCYCHGGGYNSYSCLPEVESCRIERRSSANTVAYLHGKTQATFSCAAPSGGSGKKTGAEVHVLSVLSARRYQRAAVKVTRYGAPTDPVVLVLASYFPVRWQLQLEADSRVERIIQICTLRLHECEVTVEMAGRERAPVVTKQRFPTGYGDDRRGGQTLALLRQVERTAGRISAFSGTPYANQWTVTTGKPSASANSSQTASSASGQFTITHENQN